MTETQRQDSLQPTWLADETFRREAEEIIAQYVPVLDSFARLFGPKSEVVLHDLSKLPGSVVAVSQSLSGRGVGAPSTSLALAVMSGKEYPTHLHDYRTEMPNGTICRSSTLFLYGSSPHPLAALCVNTDVTDVVRARDVLSTLAGSGTLPERVAEPETFYQDIGTMTEDILRRSIEAIGVDVSEMTKIQKVQVVAELERRGFFIVREAADLAAHALHVTRYTIYNYLNEIRE